MFVITTDGMENASREYSYKDIKNLINRQKKEYNWEFIFLGANIDAEETAETIGISRDRAANYSSDSKGTLLNYEVVSETVTSFRSNSKISKDWKRKIDDEFERKDR